MPGLSRFSTNEIVHEQLHFIEKRAFDSFAIVLIVLDQSTFARMEVLEDV